MNILIVSTQFPYPPHFGFATRVYQLARQLTTRHRVMVLSYARPDERGGVAELARQMPVRVVERDPGSMRAKRMAQLVSVGSMAPFACRAVHTAAMQEAITEVCSREDFDVIQLESSLLCAFSFPAGPRIVLDEHNIEYEVFQRMCEGERSLPRRAFNRLESERFRRFEQRWWARVDGCAVTSDRERPIVCAHAPDKPVAVVPNGVDLDYFHPAHTDVEPKSIVFNGILAYRPNFDAAYHLVDDIWPVVRQRCPQARLTIVGRGDPADLRRLRRPGVEVTGEVPDIRPYLASAAVVAVPVRIGGGTRLKVVEGQAMGKAMVSTSLGCEGVAVRDGEHLLIGDDAASFADRVLELFGDPDRRFDLGLAGRRLIEMEYSWEQAGERLEALHAAAVAGAGATDRVPAAEQWTAAPAP